MRTTIENTIQYLKANRLNVNVNSLELYSLFVSGGTISRNEAKNMMLHFKINYKANQLIFGAENVNAKITSFCPLHIEEYNKLFIE